MQLIPSKNVASDEENDKALLLDFIDAATDGLSILTDVLNEMHDLAVDAFAPNLSSSALNTLGEDFADQVTLFDTVAQQASYRGFKLLDGEFSGLNFNTYDNGNGDDEDADRIRFTMNQSFRTAAMGLDDLSLTTTSLAEDALTAINNAAEIITREVNRLRQTGAAHFGDHFRRVADDVIHSQTKTLALNIDFNNGQTIPLRMATRQTAALSYLGGGSLSKASISFKV